MLLQMFELLNRLEDAGAGSAKISFELDYSNAPHMALRVVAVAPLGDGGCGFTARSFTGEELLLIPLDDGGQMDRMSKVLLIELEHARKNNPA